MEKLNVKRLLLLCLPIVFSVSLAVTLAACMAEAGNKPEDPVLPDTKPTVGSIGSLGLAYESAGDGNCTLIGIGSCGDKEIKIPLRNENGDLVTGIGASAFLGQAEITAVEIPSSVRSIGSYAFYGTGIHTVAIPSSVRSIGESTFGNCKNLCAINVDGGNEHYSSIDGVLFSADKSILICYPSGKTDSGYTIRKGVGSIAGAAFFKVPALTSVSFNGSEAEWKLVNIGPNNESLTDLKMTFKTGSAK